MKRIKRFIVVAVVSLMPLFFALPAAALGSCSIGYTGPDSNNQCTSQTTYTCTVTNENNVTIVNNNDHTSSSGTVTGSDTTQTGGSISGQVTNKNGVIFNVSITNPVESPRTCVAVATVPATTEPPVTPVQPPTGSGAVAALPHTSGDSLTPIVSAVVAVFGIGAITTYVGATIYRRLKS